MTTAAAVAAAAGLIGNAGAVATHCSAVTHTRRALCLISA